MLSRPQLYLSVASLFAGQSTCSRGQVGAVIVKDRRIIGTGYNGAPPGMPHCLDVGCDMSLGAEAGCQRTIHAEANALAWAARSGIPVLGATMYSTHSPCPNCAKLLVSAGIMAFYYGKDYRRGDLEFLETMGVEVARL